MLPETVIREVGESSVTVSLEAADPVLKYAEQNGLITLIDLRWLQTELC